MPPGSHQPRSTRSRPVGSDLMHGLLPLHVFLLPLNGCCPWVVPQSGAFHTDWLILPVIVLASSACHAPVSCTRAWSDLAACSSGKAAVHFVHLGHAQCECHWLALLHGMQPLCRCLALHQDPLVEAHCVQLRHGLLLHTLLRILLCMQMCLDQQPILACAQMGVTHLQEYHEAQRKWSRTSTGAVSCTWSSLRWKLST